jgi:hypothetical protein
MLLGFAPNRNAHARGADASESRGASMTLNFRRIYL